MHNRSLAVAGVLLGAALSAAPGHADTPGRGPVQQGTLVLGAEHLTGIVHNSLTAEGQTIGVTSINLIGYESLTIYDTPRFAFDGFVVDGLSIGGTVALMHAEVSPPEGNGTSATDVLIMPRVGYAYMFSEAVGIWPRAGFSYWHRGSSDGSESAHAFALDLDCPLVLFPVKHFAITVGPVFDTTVGGSVAFTDAALGGANPGFSVTQVGVSAGVAGFF